MLQASPALWVVVIIYLLFQTGLGIYSGRKAKVQDLNDYHNAGRSVSPLAVALAATMTSLSGGTLVGFPGQVAFFGLGAYFSTYVLGGNLGTLVSIIVVAKPMRRLSEKFKSITITDLLCSIYKTDVIRYFVTPALIFSMLLMGVAQWAALGNLTYLLLGVSYKTSIIICVIVTFIYIIVGGSNSSASVAVFQGFVALAASVYLVGVAVRAGGGITTLHENIAAIDPALLQATSDRFTGWTFFSYICLWAFGQCAQPHVTTKFQQIKDPKFFPKCIMFAAIFLCVINFITLIGLPMVVDINRGLIPEFIGIDTVTAQFISAYCTPVIGGLVVAACLAATMSTVASVLLTASSVISVDLIGKIFKQDISGRKGITYNNIAMIIVTIASMLLALFPFDVVYQLTNAAWGVNCAVLWAPFVLGIRWRRSHKNGAIASMAVGLPVILIVRIAQIAGWTWPFKLDSSLTVTFISIAVFVVVSLLNPAEDKSHYMPEITGKEMNKKLRDYKLGNA